MKLNEGSGFELIYPPLGEEEKEEQYEAMIKKANDIWDEFTTGKSKKKVDEQKVEKRKSQPVVKTPIIDQKDSSIEETDSEEEEGIKTAVVELPVQTPVIEKEPKKIEKTPFRAVTLESR